VGATLLDVRPINSADPGFMLGLPAPEDYRHNPHYLGVTAGPVANRIGGARFEIEGRIHRLEANEGDHQLHGGPRGFGTRLWDVEIDPATTSARFDLRRDDGDGGYPGNLDVEVTYTLDGPQLIYRWTARTDAPTPVSLTNHAYWNLGRSQDETATVVDHRLQVSAGRVVEVDSDLIPTGSFVDVDGGPLDLRSLRRLGDVIDEIAPGGIDHCFVLDRDDDGGPGDDHGPAMVLSHPKSGARITIDTTLPAVQVYTGQYLDGSPECGGHERFAGVCLETQHIPDAVNNPNFPSCMVAPGTTTTHTTVYTFELPNSW
jgi:aldose 1-epimerase